VRVAHELAHSWTGNLVTNASMDHFWLNEGFTVYAERRILEATEGPERVAFHAAIGYAALLEELRRFGPDSEYTKLRMNLQGQRTARVGPAVACRARNLIVVLAESLRNPVGMQSPQGFQDNRWESSRCFACKPLTMPHEHAA
jgi:hypothetical protein